MNNSDNPELIIVILVFVGFVALMMYYYWQGDKLFKLLAMRHPKYYKENGEPLYFGESLGNLWAGVYLMLLLIRGVPKDFPNDTEAHGLALQSRRIGLVLFLCLALILGAVYYNVSFAQ